MHIFYGDYKNFIENIIIGNIKVLRLHDGFYEVDDNMIPIGGVHISLVSTDPGLSQLDGGLGYGSWTRISQGRAIVGVDESDPDFQTVNTNFGSKTATPAGVVSQPTFTGNPFTAIINHTHPITDPGHTHVQNPHQHGMAEGQTDGAGTFMDRSSAASSTTSVTDNATAVNQSATTGITTGNPVGGVTSVTPSGTISTPSFTGNSHSVCQPSLTFYIWTRIS